MELGYEINLWLSEGQPVFGLFICGSMCCVLFERVCIAPQIPTVAEPRGRQIWELGPQTRSPM